MAALFDGCSARHNDDPLEKDVFAIVGDRPLTAAFVRDTVEISFKIAQKNGRTIDPERYDAAANGMAAKIIPQLISALLMEIYLDRHNVQSTASTDAKTLARYNQLMKSKCRDLEELKALFKSEGKTFARQFRRESRVLALSEKQLAAPVSAEERQGYYVGITNTMIRAARFDALAHENSKKAYQRLQAGESWDVVAKEATEDHLIDEERSEYWKEWDDVPLDSYAYPEVLKAIEGLEVGSYSKPFESEMGLLIVRINAIEDGVRKCSRMLFRMSAKVEPVPPEKLDAYLNQQKVRNLHNRCLDEIGETIQIEYPKGKEFHVRIWPLDKNNKEDAK